MTRTTRRGRPADVETRLADARSALDQADTVIVTAARQFLQLVNQQRRDIRDARAFIDDYTAAA